MEHLSSQLTTWGAWLEQHPNTKPPLSSRTTRSVMPPPPSAGRWTVAR